MKALTYIEVDVPSFVTTSPETTETFRFTYPTDYAPTDIEAIPSMASVAFTPATISLGKDLGTRASLTVTFIDHRHIFNGEPFNQGTFWGKWRARYGARLQGRSIRWIQGLLGQAIEEMETRHFIVDSVSGPTPQGVYTITAKDILKFLDGDKAQAPKPNSGFLVAGIDNNDLSFTLSPAGIGDFEYASSGLLNIGGEEIVSFTRSGDVVTITARGQEGTTAVAHDAGARVQTVLQYIGEDPADIIHDLISNYTNTDPATIPLGAWQNETATFLQQNYTATIAEPHDVKELVVELIQTAALAIWWEPLTQLIQLRVLRAIPQNALTFDEDNTLEGTLSVRDQPATRVSQVFVYFGQRNPLLPIDEENNYRSAVLTIDAEAEAEYGVSAIQKVFSRWIPFGARSVAVRLSNLVLGRFRDPPRRFAFNLFRHGSENPQLGGGYRVKSWTLQDVTGLPVDAPLQITRLNPLSDRYEVEAEEMLFTNLDPADLTNRNIIIDAAVNNVNLRALHDTIFPDPNPDASPPESLTVTIESNVKVGSIDPAMPAFDVGDWPEGYPITINVLGHIRGAGGDGGAALVSPPVSGQAGGTALFTRADVTVEIMAGGTIWGGGGGGGGAVATSGGEVAAGGGGGGGAGVNPGDGGAGFDEGGTPGTETEGGTGGFAFLVIGGDGGAPGAMGGTSFGSAGGGAAGRSIDGISFVTLADSTPSGIKGPQVN